MPESTEFPSPRTATTYWETYRRLLKYAKPYWRRLAVGVVFAAVHGGTYGAFPILVKHVASTVFQFDSGNAAMVIVIVALFPVVGLISGVSDYLSRYLIRWVGHRVVFDLRTELFEHISRLSLSFFGRSKTGDLMSRLTSDTVQVQGSISNVLTNVAQQPFKLIAFVAIVFWLAPKLAFFSLILFPLCLVPMLLFGRRVRRHSRELQARLGELSSIMQEMVTGIRVVKAFGMEQYEMERFCGRNKRFMSHAMSVVRAKSANEPIIMFLAMVGVSLSVLYARSTRMPLDAFLTFVVALLMLYDPFKKLSGIHLRIQQSCAGADRIFEVLDTQECIREAPDAVVLSEEVSEVGFTNVTFGYDRDVVLQDITFSVPAGTSVAIVGSSGSGKTTLVSLIPRFFDVSGGSVCVNGHDVRALTLRSLRDKIGIVTQDTVLFNDTIASNIAYGHLEATAEKIERAARQAHAHRFVSEMPQGYDTVIGERGVLLSGGQRQRLAIARAILRNPPILILDEATSALDTESERLVQAAIDDLMKGRTVFAIAHRLSTIINCDRILVLREGRIVEDGRHGELLAKDGAYKRFYDMQFETA